jgi:hypothetical protein
MRHALRTMGRARSRLGASLDARQSIELVGSSTARAQELEATLDPIGAARRWLAARVDLDEDVRDQAGAALDAADALVRDIDATAGSIARDARATGQIPDPVRIAEVETMAATLARFCNELHSTLREVEAGADGARGRLTAAAMVAQAEGGIPAATVILGAAR